MPGRNSPALLTESIWNRALKSFDWKPAGAGPARERRSSLGREAGGTRALSYAKSLPMRITKPRAATGVCAYFPRILHDTGNAELVRAASENVIRNAVSHTEEGTQVDVMVLKHVPNSQGGDAVIRVRDHGKGVPEASLADIFLPFYRVGDARERSAGGSGLGLSITDRAVRLHGGSVKAENCADGGLVVELRFPADDERKEPAARDAIPSALASLIWPSNSICACHLSDIVWRRDSTRPYQIVRCPRL